MKKLLLISLLVVGCDEETALEQAVAEVEQEAEDCAGVAGGDAVVDECGVCSGDALSCEQPELFVFNQSEAQAFYYFNTVTINDEEDENLEIKSLEEKNKPLKFDDNLSHQQITLELNKILEKMILKNPDQWIWSHDRWK